jgi:hypothetical protein
LKKNNEETFFNDDVGFVSLAEQKEVWLRAWTSLVATDGLSTLEEVNLWSDGCLNAYAKRFSDSEE